MLLLLLLLLQLLRAADGSAVKVGEGARLHGLLIVDRKLGRRVDAGGALLEEPQLLRLTLGPHVLLLNHLSVAARDLSQAALSILHASRAQVVRLIVIVHD